MVFFICLCISLIYCYLLGIHQSKGTFTFSAYIFALAPLLILWILISGMQYYVGQDYPHYIDIFNGKYIDRYEPGFKAIIFLCHHFGIKGQSIYFVFYVICFTFFGLILQYIEKKYIWIYILLFFTVSNIFNNELNILRQCTAIYIGTFSFLLYIKKKYKLSVLIYLLALSIHISIILFILLPILKPIINKTSKRGFIQLLVTSLALSIILNIGDLNIITKYLPANFGWYITEHSGESSTLGEKIPKYIYIPFYYYSIKWYPKFNLTKFNTLLFKYGIIFFCFRLSLLNLPIVYRLSDNFLLISIFPLYFLLQYLHKTRNFRLEFIIVSFLIFTYFIKTIILPSGEYLYKSIIPIYII